MNNKELFDREQERNAIREFFVNNDKFLLIYGESGVGKSSIVEKIINDFFSINQLLIISFKSNKNLEYTNENINLKEKLHLVYKKNRKYSTSFINKISNIQPNTSVNAGMGLLGPTVGISISNNSLENIIIDENYIIQLDKILYNNSYKLLYISNIELCNSNEDIVILEHLYNLAENKELNIKILFEIGTLKEENLHSFIKNIKYQNNKLNIKPFSESFTKGFYEFYHNKEAPLHIFNKTRGNPFYIVHYTDNLKQFKLDDIIKQKLSSIDEELLDIVYILHVVGGTLSLESFQEYINLDPKILNRKLEKLNLLEIIKIENNSITFFHSFFSIFLNKIKSSFLLIEHTQSIINKLLNQKDKLTNDQILLLINLLNQNNKHLEVVTTGWKFCIEAYELQKYYLTIPLCKLIIDSLKQLNNSNIYFPYLILIQSYILIGNSQNTSRYLNHIPDNKKDYLFPCIEAQLLYQENKFLDSIKKIENILPKISNDIRLQAILFGLNTSNYLALGNLKSLQNNYTSALNLSEHLDDKEIYFETLRLSPKVFGWNTGIKLISKFIESPISSKYAYTKYKSLHNIGFAKIISSHGEEGINELLEAKQFFDYFEMPEFTYSVVALSVYYILKNKLNKALNELLDGLNFAHEQYDRFAIYTNIGNVYLLKKDYTLALVYFEKALETLNDSLFPLYDPILRHKANYNLSLINLLLKKFSLANKYFVIAKVPQTASFYEERVARNKWLQTKISSKDDNINLINSTYNKENWPVTKFNCSLSKLSFFDFNLRIITNKYIPISII